MVNSLTLFMMKVNKMFLSSRRLVLFTLAFCLFVGTQGVLLKLAHWQFTRWQQAQAFELSLKEKLAAPATAYVPNHSQEYDMVQLTGVFDHTRSRWLANQKHLGHNGWRLLTPFVMADSEIIVDRGWHKDQQTLPDLEAYTSSVSSVQGMLRHFPVRSGWLQGPVTNTDPRELLFLEPSAVPTQNGVTRATVYLQAKTPTHQKVVPAATGMYDGPPHLQYMLTWLSLSILLPILFIWRVFSAWRSANRTSR